MAAKASLPKPTSSLEQDLLRQYPTVVGMDEVGRGSLAGPVAVGAVLIDGGAGTGPDGVADSKLLSPRQREELVSPITRWSRASAVGWATPSEITNYGLTQALRLAGLRALNIVVAAHRGEPLLSMRGEGASICVLLDGKHDWLSMPQASLFGEQGVSCLEPFDVVTKIKADQLSQVVASASVLAKVARDTYMVALPDPGYDWAGNKGYASRRHVTALRELGACNHHRLGWRLPGLDP